MHANDEAQRPRAARLRSAESAGGDVSAWSATQAALLGPLRTQPSGLSAREAQARLATHGPNRIAAAGGESWMTLLVTRFTSPLVLILLVAASVSLLTRQWLDASIVLAIVVLTAVLSFFQEYRATVAVDALRSRVAPRSRVRRDGTLTTVDSETLVPGDIVELDAGSIVPADLRLIEARDCVVDQSLLTGEAEPVEKRPGDCDPAAGPARRFNSLFMGTSLRSGWACAVVVDTGAQAVYGSIAGQLEAPPPATEFERGLHDFGALLIRVMLAVVATVLAVNVVLQRPAVEMLLFAAALAVGLSPELLPAILTVTLSHGARAMAKCGVIVKRLDAIENLGSVDLLCTDKTGTLTRGVEQLDGAVDAGGDPSSSVLRLAAANARLQTGLRNSLDDAIFRYADTAGVNWAPPRIAELPYDFHRRRLSVLVDDGASSADASTGRLLITKGAVREMLAICTRITNGAADAPLDAPTREVIDRRFIEWSGEGYRVLAVATRRVDRPEIGRDDERDMRLEGFLLFLDPPEPQVRATLATLAARNVAVRMITGDNRHVAQHVARAIGMDARQVMVGPELQGMSVAQLAERVRGTAVFAEIDPDQKERIIHALRRAGHVVGYLGDGINDAAALHAADVGISVDTAVDVAQQAADFVLLRHDLDVLRAGIDEGRRTFANTLKYVFITTSANFGNMLSMAFASLLLPFLPLLAKQILLNNFLSDIPAMGIAGDRIDEEWIRRPHRWDMRRIRRALLVFGLTSTAFDVLTFAMLLAATGRSATSFRTGWFVESLLTELCVLLVIRTRRHFWRSRPGTFLWSSALVVAVVALLLPYSPFAPALGFAPLPVDVLALVVLITLLYVVASELGKRWFYGSGE